MSARIVAIGTSRNAIDAARKLRRNSEMAQKKEKKKFEQINASRQDLNKLKKNGNQRKTRVIPKIAGKRNKIAIYRKTNKIKLRK